MQIKRNLEQYESPVHTYESLESFFGSTLANGVHSIGYGEGHLDLLLDDRGFSTTLVMFHAAVLRTFDSLPMFVGRKVTENLEANLIFVSDPSLEYGINLAWFGGDHARSLQTDLPRVISHLLKSMDNHKHLMLFGPSGGGFACMYYASHFPGSLAIPMNPQTNISRYREADVQAYTRAAWGGINISEAPFCSNLNSIYASSIDHHVAYIQNLGDISHVKKYLAPLLVNLPEQSKPNVGIKLGEWGKGHKPAPGRSLVRLFRDGIACEGDWPQMFRNQNLNLNLSAEELIKKSEFYYNTMTSHSE